MINYIYIYIEINGSLISDYANVYLSSKSIVELKTLKNPALETVSIKSLNSQHLTDHYNVKLLF